MRSQMKNNRSCRAFTLVEILAVMLIISILIGLLIPALGYVQKMAANVRQKAQFSNIEVGLESFNNDFGDYPPSDFYCELVGCKTPYQGAQKLAEAMVGMDGYGFHKDSIFAHNGMDGGMPSELLYDIDPASPLTTDPILWKENLSRRKGPYLELEVANAVKYSNLDPASTLTGLVLSDKFGLLKNAATGKKAGKPILYYKANRKAADLVTSYSYSDNYSFTKGCPFGDAGSISDGKGGYLPKFYDTIKNPNFTINERPYKADSYILISAGADGIYGTADDVMNFEVE